MNAIKFPEAMMNTLSLLRKLPKRLLTSSNGIKNVLRSSSVWTTDKIVESPFPSVEIPNRTVVEHIWENIQKWADKTAVECGFTGQKYSYSQLYVYSRNFATRLRNEFHIKDGDVICVMLPNLAEMPLVILGALQAGAVVTTANPIYTPHEISRQLKLSGAKLAIGTKESIHVLKESLKLNQSTMPLVTVHSSNEATPEGTASFHDLIEGSMVDTSVLTQNKRKSEDVCFLPYSSGTTGLPKGVELTHKNIVANCCQCDEPHIKQYLDTTSKYQDQVLVVLPMFHIYGLTILTLHKLSVGAKLVVVPKFHPESLPAVLEKHPITMIYAAPPLVLYLGSHPAITAKHLAHVRFGMSGAAPAPIADIKNLFSKAQRDVTFVQGYGLTETSPLVSVNTLGSRLYDRVGPAAPNTRLRIVDTELNNLGPNQQGELLVYGPQVMRGYKDNAEATSAALVQGGWFRTGDLASIDEEGQLKIHDRLKELIKVKGFQVPPAELEGVLKEHPDVLDAAVVGVPHKSSGEVPKAFVVKKDGGKATSKEILNFVAERVAQYKKIHELQFLEALPKNPTGKILRRELKEKYC